MAELSDVLIIGAGAAGLSTLESLRRKGFTGSVTVVGAEKWLPYDRPPLSKQVLAGTWDIERTQLRAPDALDDLNAVFLLDDPVVSLDSVRRHALTESGRELGAETIVIATGVRARTLPGQDGLDGVFAIRTRDDALALRARFAEKPRVVVVGEGVLGVEAAATANSLGLDVTVVGPLAHPMLAQIGPLVGAALGRVHAEHGVRLRLGAGVARLSHSDGKVNGVILADGEELPADVVVVAIGSIPETEWLADSGVTLDNGIVCDSYCRAAESIYAVGDVCRWYDESRGAHIRLENRTNATDQAAAVAAAIVGSAQPYTPIPYFWTDQYDIKIQVHGVITPDADVEIVDGSLDEGRFVAAYRTNGYVTAVLGWRMPKQSRLRRQLIVDDLSRISALPSPAV
ncbi:MAG: FAD-dependent oxidoreductase [Gordonia sp. (in: high G+C Gram-positive bacteria)]